MIAPATLALLLQACAPTVNAQTQAALVTVESDATVFALHDNNTGRSYFPRRYGESVLLVEKLLRDDTQRFGARKAGIDVGLAQIDSDNFVQYGLTPEIVLDPCMNLRVGSMMLTSLYGQEYAALAGEPDVARKQHALSRALQRYNSGKPTGDQQYVAAVLMAAGQQYVRATTAYETPITESTITASAPQRPMRSKTDRDTPFGDIVSHPAKPYSALWRRHKMPAAFRDDTNPDAPFGDIISHTADR
jgi:type IV secretion system protein VirB1